MKYPKLALIPLVLALVSAGCAVNPQTGKTEFNRTGIGATIGGIAGGVVGAVVAGTDGALVGVAAGAAAGGGAGYWMDKRAKKLEADLEGTGLEVQSSIDPQSGAKVITITAPADISFDSGSAALQSSVYAGLTTIAQSVKPHPEMVIEVTGHTDSTGSDSLNSVLSTARAQSVAAYLYAAGVPVSSVRTRGVGPSMPAADNSTAAGRAKNRRVEIQIYQI